MATALRRGVLRMGGAGAGRWAAGGGVALLLLLHFGVSPLLRLVLGDGMRQLAITQEAHARRLDVAPCDDARWLYMLTGSDPTNSMYLASSTLFYVPERVERFEVLRTLSMARARERALNLLQAGPLPPYLGRMLRALTVSTTVTSLGAAAVYGLYLSGGATGLAVGAAGATLLGLSVFAGGRA